MNKEQTVKTGKNRLSNGRFAPGNAGNPNGRPRKPEVEILRRALEAVKEERGMGFIEHFVRLAYKNHNVAIALAKKLIPDKIEGEGFGDKYNIFRGEQIDHKRMQVLVALVREKASTD